MNFPEVKMDVAPRFRVQRYSVACRYLYADEEGHWVTFKDYEKLLDLHSQLLLEYEDLKWRMEELEK